MGAVTGAAVAAPAKPRVAAPSIVATIAVRMTFFIVVIFLLV
jgi:hypothetical protein